MSAAEAQNVVELWTYSNNVTTFTQSVSSGATETITLGAMANVAQYAYNNVNELVSLDPGGAMGLHGASDKAIDSASIATQVVTISAAAPANTTFSQSIEGAGATETISTDQYKGGTRFTIGGTATAGDTISLTFYDANLPHGPETVTYIVQSGDSLSSIASGLWGVIEANSDVAGSNGLGLNPSYDGTNHYVLIQNAHANAMPASYSYSLASAPTETMNFDQVVNGNTAATVGGSATVGDVLSLTVENTNLSGGQESVDYTVQSGDSLSDIASALNTAFNADSALAGIGLSSTVSSETITIAAAGTTYDSSTSGGASETISLGSNTAGNTSATIGGTPTTSDTVTVTVYNAALSGGQESVDYVVQSGDTLVDVAAGLATAINSDSSLQALGISASNSSDALLSTAQKFKTNPVTPSGTSLIAASATDAASNNVTNDHAVVINGPSSATLTYDKNGNMTSDGTNDYAWDCQNRLIRITYPGSGNYTVLAYDGTGGNVLIQEYDSSSLLSTRQFVGAEERNASGTVIKQFFERGEMISGSVYYYTFDHLRSIRELVDSSESIQSEYSFDPFGRVITVSSGVSSDFQYGGYYFHSRSALSFPLRRAYTASYGRWLNRDPIEEGGGINLFSYVGNQPTGATDPSGLAVMSQLRRYMDAICDSCDCVPQKLNSKCKRDALLISTAIRVAYEDHVLGPRGPSPSTNPFDQVNGYYCWDYATAFYKAYLSAVSQQPQIWHARFINWPAIGPPQVSPSDGKTYVPTHWALKIGTNSLAKCTLTLDDHATGMADGEVHSGSWGTGPGFWPSVDNANPPWMTKPVH